MGEDSSNLEKYIPEWTESNYKKLIRFCLDAQFSELLDFEFLKVAFLGIQYSFLKAKKRDFSNPKQKNKRENVDPEEIKNLLNTLKNDESRYILLILIISCNIQPRL